MRKDVQQIFCDLRTVYDIAVVSFARKDAERAVRNGLGDPKGMLQEDEVKFACGEVDGNANAGEGMAADVGLVQHEFQERIFGLFPFPPRVPQKCGRQTVRADVHAASDDAGGECRFRKTDEERRDSAVRKAVQDGVREILRADEGEDVFGHVAVVKLSDGRAFSVAARVERVDGEAFGEEGNRPIEDLVRFAVSVQEQKGRPRACFFKMNCSAANVTFHKTDYSTRMAESQYAIGFFRKTLHFV